MTKLLFLKSNAHTTVAPGDTGREKELKSEQGWKRGGGVQIEATRVKVTHARSDVVESSQHVFLFGNAWNDVALHCSLDLKS